MVYQDKIYLKIAPAYIQIKIFQINVMWGKMYVKWMKTIVLLSEGL